MKLLLLFVAIVSCIQAASYDRKLLQSDDFATRAEEEVNSFISKTYGGACFTDDQCTEYVSHCEREGINPKGECKLFWWVWLIIGAVVLLFVGAVISCCCCPCCLCYVCCSAIVDCLCCCCRNKGYSPASRG